MIDTFSDFGGGSYRLSYWFEISSFIALFTAITGATYFTFIDPNYAPAPTFPVGFTSTSGADTGFMTTQEPMG